ncbi:MAG TPA: hypothetical protein VIP77_12770 [Jiangellaceae bacterium]
MPGPGMLTLMVLPAVIGLIIVARPNVAVSLTKLRGVWLIALAAVLQFVQNNGWWPGPRSFRRLQSGVSTRS